MFSQYTVPDQSTKLAPPVLSPNAVHSDPQCLGQQFALTFIDSKQGVRRLSAENAAKHRQAIFSGRYYPSYSMQGSNADSYRDGTPVDEQ